MLSSGATRYLKSKRFALRRAAEWLAHQKGRCSIRQWERRRLECLKHPNLRIDYVGRRDWLSPALSLLGMKTSEFSVGQIPHSPRAGAAMVSELPLAGTLRVPWLISAVVPLAGSLAAVLAGFDSELRRRIRKERPHYESRQVSDVAEIDELERSMLRPYAADRHGDGAAQISPQEVRAAALGYGRLDVLLRDGQPVACHLGNSQVRSGRRLWVTHRFGYPKEIYEVPRQLRDVNSMNAFMAMEWAERNSYDGYDLGWALARPQDGLLQWKRRRGGELDPSSNVVHFHVRPPSADQARFFWNSPLFVREGAASLALYVGLPSDVDLAAAHSRFRELRYAGLGRIVLVLGHRPGGDRDEAVAQLSSVLGAGRVVTVRE